MQALVAPPYPEDLAYLHEWATQLHGRCGVSMAGLLPLNHQEIREWAALTGHRPTPLDVEGLLTLDAVMLHPEKPRAQEPTKAPARAWPERKRG